jgi:hypothetical protein
MKKFIRNYSTLKAVLALCGTGLLFLNACALKDRVVDVNNTFLEDVDILGEIQNLLKLDLLQYTISLFALIWLIKISGRGVLVL